MREHEPGQPVPLHQLKIAVDHGKARTIAHFTDPNEIPRLLREAADEWEKQIAKGAPSE